MRKNRFVNSLIRYCKVVRHKEERRFLFRMSNDCIVETNKTGQKGTIRDCGKEIDRHKNCRKYLV